VWICFNVVSYLVLGDLIEALLLLTLASLSIVIALVQESRSERVLEALCDLTSPQEIDCCFQSRRRASTPIPMRANAFNGIAFRGLASARYRKQKTCGMNLV